VVVDRVDENLERLEWSFDLALPKRVWSSQSSTGCPRMLAEVGIRWSGCAFVLLRRKAAPDLDTCAGWRVAPRAYGNRYRNVLLSVRMGHARWRPAPISCLSGHSSASDLWTFGALRSLARAEDDGLPLTRRMISTTSEAAALHR
jgi:hypothetical protein